MKKIMMAALLGSLSIASTSWAQSASDAAAQGGNNDVIVQMHQQIAAANRVYDKKVAAARKVYDQKKADAAKERDAAVAAARNGTSQ
jgi:hypothetical protein